MKKHVLVLLSLSLALISSCATKSYIVAKKDPELNAASLKKDLKLAIQMPRTIYIEDKIIKKHISEALEQKGYVMVSEKENPQWVLRFRRIQTQSNSIRYVPRLQTDQIVGQVNGKHISAWQTRWVSEPVLSSSKLTDFQVAAFKQGEAGALEETVWEGALHASSRDFSKHKKQMISQLMCFLGENFEGKVKVVK